MEEHTKPVSHLRTYAIVFAALAVITILEVALSGSGIGIGRSLLTPTFLLFSLAKAGLVAAFFMHLRHDSRLYTMVFLFPAALLVVFTLLASVR